MDVSGGFLTRSRSDAVRVFGRLGYEGGPHACIGLRTTRMSPIELGAHASVRPAASGLPFRHALLRSRGLGSSVVAGRRSTMPAMVLAARGN